MKQVRIRVGFERILHKIDIKSIENNIDFIEKTSDKLKVIDHLRSTLDFKIQQARGKMMSLHSHRHKRALVNALGSVIKLIAGNPDNDDMEIINHNLDTLERQENFLSKSLSKQIIINEKIQNKINNITDILKKINKQIVAENNNSITIRTDLEYINLIVNLDILIQILSNIEEQIEFAKLNILNRNLFSFDEKTYIFNRLRTQKLQLDYVDQIFQYTSGSVIVKGGEILVLAKIPILEDNEFDLINVQTLNLNNTRISTDVRLVAKHGDIIYKQTHICDICEATTFLEDECIHNLLNHLTPKCILRPVRQPVRIEEIKKGIILIDTNQKVLISDSCNSSRLVNTPTIIETSNCTIKVMNFTFNSQIQPTNHEEYLLPIFGSKLIQLNYTEEKDDITHLKIENLNSLQDIKLDLHRSTRTTAIGGGILLALTFLCSFTVYIINRRTKAKKETHLEIRDHEETTQEHTVTTKKGDFGPLPRLLLFDRSSEDGRQSERGGVKPQPTDRSTPEAKTSAKPNQALATRCTLTDQSTPEARTSAKPSHSPWQQLEDPSQPRARPPNYR